MYDELVKQLRGAYAAEAFVSRLLPEGKGNVTAALFKEAADAIEALSAKVPHWIPVEKRLPEECEWVLCLCRANIYEVLRWQDGEWYHDNHRVYMSGFVTHWMPRPEPPEREVEA